LQEVEAHRGFVSPNLWELRVRVNETKRRKRSTDPNRGDIVTRKIRTGQGKTSIRIISWCYELACQGRPKNEMAGEEGGGRRGREKNKKIVRIIGRRGNRHN